MLVNMHEAKTTLSKLVDLAYTGEEVIIAKAGKAVAILKPYTEVKQPRKPGALKGKPLDMTEFDNADSSVKALFEGED